MAQDTIQLAEGDSWSRLDPYELDYTDDGRAFYRRTYWPAGRDPEERNDGSMPQAFVDEEELAEIRNSCRVIAVQHPVGIGIVRRLTDYAVSTGYTLTAQGIDGVSEELVAAVQDVIDRVADENDWHGDLDRELFGRVVRDGEYFLSLYPQAGGHMVMRSVDPGQITEPQNPKMIEHWLGHDGGDWTFGVHTDVDDAQQIHGYYVQWNQQGEFDYFTAQAAAIGRAAGVIEHAKANVDRGIKRGLSDFFPVIRYLERTSRLLRNTTEGASVQAAIAFIREAAQGVTLGKAQGERLVSTDQTYTHDIPAGGQRTHYIRKMDPGTILTTSAGTKYMPGPLGSDRALHFIEVVQAGLRIVGSRWSMPEYMVSGDASNANYASTLVAESPFTKAIQASQHWFGRRTQRIYWVSLRFAYDAGLFSRWVNSFEQLEKLIEIKAEPPQIVVRDQNKETERHEKLAAAGVMSAPTWAAREGLDYEEEVAQGARPMALPVATAQPAVVVPRPPRELTKMSEAIEAFWASYP